MSRIDKSSLRVGAVVTALLLAACATSPTGRKQLLMFPENKVNQMGVAAYEDIKKNAPRIAPNATFAFTAMATKTVKSHKVDGSGCSYKGFKTSVIYNFIVPKRDGATPLAKATAKNWEAFVAYLVKHEEGHRDTHVGLRIAHPTQGHPPVQALLHRRVGGDGVFHRR